MIDFPNLPEWLLADAVDPGGYTEDDLAVYLFHTREPRFVLRVDDPDELIEDGLTDPDITWLDPEPEAEKMATLIARAARIIAACHEDDVRRARRE